MLSDRELRWWGRLLVVLLWGIVTLMLWDEIQWAQVHTIDDTLRHLQRPMPLLQGVGIGTMLCGAVFVTRLLVRTRRERRPDG
jgi:hypothetical protein